MLDVFRLDKASVVVVELIEAIIDHWVLEVDVRCESDDAITVCATLRGADIVVTDHHIVNFHGLEE